MSAWSHVFHTVNIALGRLCTSQVLASCLKLRGVPGAVALQTSQCLMPVLLFWHTQVMVPGYTEGLQRPRLKQRLRGSTCYASCVMSLPLHFSPLLGAVSWDNTHPKQLGEWQETWMCPCQKRVHVRNERPKNIIGVFKGIFGLISPNFVPFCHNFRVHRTLKPWMPSTFLQETTLYFCTSLHAVQPISVPCSLC